MLYQAIAKIATTHETQQVCSGLWECKEKAYAELAHMVAVRLPMGIAYRVVQSIVTIKDED